MKDLRYLKNGQTLRVCGDTCTGCGACLEVCPHAVLELREGKARVRDPALCMECGACARNCPFGAITVQAGVGCAGAIILGKLKGTAPTCDGSASCGCGNGC